MYITMRLCDRISNISDSETVAAIEARFRSNN